MKHKILELVQGMEKGGRTKRIAETAIGLQELGWHVKVLPMTPVPEWVRSIYTNELDWVELDRMPKLDLPYVFRLASFMRREGITLVHAHCEASYFYGGLAGRLCNIPVVGTYHRSDLRYFQNKWKLRFFARLLTRAVAISNDRKNLMISKLGIDAHKITLVHGGVNFREFKLMLPEQVEQLKIEQGLTNRRILLSAGHLGPIKGHETTLQALPQIVARFPDILLLIAGDGSAADYDRLNKMIAELNLKEHVRLLGQVGNVVELMSACDIFVQPSLEEGFGLVFVEAGACRKAVVATAVGGIKDIIVHEETGLLVAPGDVNALAQALSTLLDDPRKTAAYGEAGFKRAHSSFALENMASGYNKLFSSLLGQP